MQNLRSALGKETQAEQASMSRKMPSKMANKSKNGSIWAIDPDDEEDDLSEQGQPKEKTKLKSYIEISLNSAFKKDPVFTEMCFFEVVEEVESKCPDSNELECLLVIEEKIHEFQKNADKQLLEFLAAFNETLVKRIKKLRKKDKKNELEEFDKIVKNNFKKKGAVEYIDEDGQRKNRLQVKEEELARRALGSKDMTKNEGSSRKNGSGSSSEGKLGKLLSNAKLKEDKKESNNEGNEGKESHEESISFSAVVSQSVTVRQRKQAPKQKKQKEQALNKKGKGENEKDAEDEAFMFFRPKATKKK